MVTDDRRREVAAKLRAEAGRRRYYREDDNIFYMDNHEFTEAILEDLGFCDADIPTYEVLDQMADLIDPTCRNLAMKPADEFLCSKCGEHVDIAYMDSCDDYHARYCPGCRARVVTSDD